MLISISDLTMECRVCVVSVFAVVALIVSFVTSEQTKRGNFIHTLYFVVIHVRPNQSEF